MFSRLSTCSDFMYSVYSSSTGIPVTLDTDKLASEFLMTFSNHALSQDQPLIMSYSGKVYSLRVKEIEG